MLQGNKLLLNMLVMLEDSGWSMELMLRDPGTSAPATGRVREGLVASPLKLVLVSRASSEILSTILGSMLG